jgi:hypothetical protein
MVFSPYFADTLAGQHRQWKTAHHAFSEYGHEINT